ncbi:MAG: MFS transporter [Gammaproteobacteria bacterium]|nr:MFS transporter [Gammaproteobacteria bacterium]
MPYWRLSAFYFFFFSSLGAMLPYWGLYLESLGFTPQRIGELMALLMATKIVSPNVWGWIADHTGRRMAIVRLGSLLAAVCFSGVLFGSGYWWLALVMVAFSFFWNATLPQFEATTFTHLGEHTHRYSTIRLWGSIGFIVAVAALGPLFQRVGVGLLPWILLGLMASIWLVSLLVPERLVPPHAQEHQPLREVLRRPEVMALLVVCFLMQASHGPYYTFYSIYLEDHGYSRSAIGQLWALGVIAEVGVFLVMHRLAPRTGLRTLFLASMGLTALRWALIGLYVDKLPVMIFAQTLHAASFGIYHAVAIQLVHKYFTGRHQGRGQALYSSLSFGAGGAVGSLYSGYVWGAASPTAAYCAAALIAAAAFLVAWRFIGAGAFGGKASL